MSSDPTREQRKQADKDAVCEIIDWLWEKPDRYALIDFDDDCREVMLDDRSKGTVHIDMHDFDDEKELAEICRIALERIKQ